MIRLEKIAELIQEKLGINYSVGVDSFPNVQNKEVSVVLTAGRVPYRVDPNTENLTIRMEFYPDSTTPSDIEQYNIDLQTLVESFNGQLYEIIDGSITYKIRLYLESSQPQMVAVIDSGRYRTLYQVTGVGIVTSSNTVMADDVLIQINSNTVKATGWSFDYSVNHTDEGGISTNVESKALGECVIRTYTINLLIDNSSFSNTLLSVIRGGTTDNLSTTYSLTIGTVTRTVTLVNAKETGYKGAFATASVTFKVA